MGTDDVIYSVEEERAYKKGRQDAAREIFEELDGITDLFAKGLINELEFYDMIAYLKKTCTDNPWASPPSLTIDGVLTLYYPDGRSIENPSYEEVIEWAQGSGIPCYESEE